MCSNCLTRLRVHLFLSSLGFLAGLVFSLVSFSFLSLFFLMVSAFLAERSSSASLIVSSKRVFAPVGFVNFREAYVVLACSLISFLVVSTTVSRWSVRQRSSAVSHSFTVFCHCSLKIGSSLWITYGFTVICSPASVFPLDWEASSDSRWLVALSSVFVFSKYSFLNFPVCLVVSSGRSSWVDPVVLLLSRLPMYCVSTPKESKSSSSSSMLTIGGSGPLGASGCGDSRLVEGVGCVEAWSLSYSLPPLFFLEGV